MDFKGRVALVTGAAVGIGRACALRFAEGGANVVAMDYNPETLEDLAAELAAYPAEALTLTCDVSDEAQVNACVEKAVAKFGRIDILINNAALWRSWKPFLETPVEEWKKFFDINVMGVVYCTRAVLGGMVERGYGRVVTVSSVAGVYGNANMVHYSASKGALIAMTKALAKEVADKGVTVNCVSPGSVSPSGNKDIHFTEPSTLAFMGRTGSDAENAAAICFLASEEASYISAQNLQVDGCRLKQ